MSVNAIQDLGRLDQPLLVFGGPYSNLAATLQIRQQAEALGFSPQQVICTGDLVAYCAQPAETVELLREWGCHVIMGNCEESLAANAEDCGCGFDAGSACSLLAVEWYRYASSNLSEEQKQWMAQLPRQISFSLMGKQYRVVHGSLEQINAFVFASTDSRIKAHQMRSAAVDVVIGGHCGIPFGETLPEGYWLNAGVIGMPANDGSAEGWYMLLQPHESGVKASWHRLSYRVSDSVNKMRAAKLCPAYAQCLIEGIWPSLDILPEPERKQTGKGLLLEPLLIR